MSTQFIHYKGPNFIALYDTKKKTNSLRSSNKFSILMSANQ